MARTTTAYLPDGRHVVVPARDVQDWMEDVNDGKTSYGLADWYTKRGQIHQDEIQGLADDNARCDHRDGPTLLVTSPAQMRMVRVCGRRACILDAMAWVERAETVDERATWRDLDGVFHVTAPDDDVDLTTPSALRPKVAPEPVVSSIAVARLAELVEDPTSGIISLVGDNDGTARITGSVEPSYFVAGTISVETEIGTVYLEADEEAVVRQDLPG